MAFLNRINPPDGKQHMEDNIKMEKKMCLHLIVDGVVQGVGFRFFTERTARRYGLSGWVRNLPDGRVEIEAEGEEGVLNAFLKDVNQGPSFSRVTHVGVEKIPAPGHRSFEVRF